MSTGSYWIDSAPGERFPHLDRDLETDVAIVGAGIVGITTALLCKRAGMRVALLDMGRVARGASGYTTAKITSGHNLVYRRLERQHGPDVARLYAKANQEGLETIAGFVDADGIDCDFERKSNYVYCESEDDVEAIRDETDAARRAGLPASFVRDSPLPFAIAAAVKLENQAQFHPRKYLLRLIARIPGDGSHVFEKSRAIGIGKNQVRASSGAVRASHIVLASHYPFLDRALLFPRLHPKRSYAIAGETDTALAPEGMFISSTEPTRSIRTISDGTRTLLLVGGEGHAVGEEHDTRIHYENLQKWAQERFGLKKPEFRWSTQDGASVDGLPYVGALWDRSSRLYVATGFAKWGMANGTTAAVVLADAIAGRKNQFASVFDPTRLTLKASASKFATENGRVGLHFFKDRLKRFRTRSAAELNPGEACIERRGLDLVAVYRDPEGHFHAVSATCTHLGCVVAWNAAELSWDCPCHGSRFGTEGRVLQGPAVRDLEPKTASVRRLSGDV